MTSLLNSFGEIVPFALSALPVLLAAGNLLLRYRTRTRERDVARITTVLDIAVLYCVLCVVYLVTKPVPGARPEIDLEPGREIASAFAAFPSDHPAVWQAAGNLVLLAVPAALIPLRVAPARAISRIGLGAIAVSIAIEVAQFQFLDGRVAAVDDVILNFAGAVIGGALTRPLWAPSGAKHRAPTWRDATLPTGM